MQTPCSENHKKKYGIPTLEELDHDAAALGEDKFPGGEQEALRRLDEHMKRTVFKHHARNFGFSTWVKSQDKMFCLSYVTRLFPYFRDGCAASRSPRLPQTPWAPAPRFSVLMSLSAACLLGPSGGGWQMSIRGWVSPSQSSFGTQCVISVNKAAPLLIV